ncbi:MAG: metallophosphoesterase [Bacteroidota bacterium]
MLLNRIAWAQVATQQPLPNQPSFTVFLIGDAGEALPDGKDPNLQLLRKQLLAAGKQSAVVFMGDNIYPKGLPNEGTPGRALAEKRLVTQLEVLKDYAGQVFIIPGNHDWQRSGAAGWQYIQNQEKFVENYLNRGNVFLPDGGCPGPVEISLSQEVTLVILDTEWFLHPWDKPGEEADCDTKDAAAIVLQLDDILSRNQHKQLIVAAHHPMYTYGPHGGYSTFKQHLFPLTDINKNVYLPLPIIGSLYPLYRKLLGDPQDIAHPTNRLMRQSLMAIFQKYPGLVFASGHEHALQHIEKDSLHFVGSGSGSKHTIVKKGKYAKFVDDKEGFARLDYGLHRAVDLTYWEPAFSETKPVYTSQWVTPSHPLLPTNAEASFADSVAVVRASEQYTAGRLKTWLVGKNYRQEWQQLLQVPLFNITTEQGGLKPLRRGGGLQTKSLRLAASDGKEYVLRSIAKDATQAVPAPLRKTLAADIVQDQISAAHPYAAITIPVLAEAAGVAHTNPRIVLIPDDPHLGEYRKVFANTLALFEEREANPPAGFIGTLTNKSYSTAKVLEKLQDDNDNRVDQHEVLRARLFDMVLADWDRHDDQWRWLAYERKDGLLFRAAPRDRDQAYFVNQGVLPKLASREWLLPKVQGFDTDFQNVSSFMFNGRYFDRSFLTEPSLADWLAMADSLKHRLTDAVIEKAVHQWPDSLFRFSGSVVIAKLKAHRDKLPAYAQQYYQFLAKEVEVVGSDKREYFEVIRQDDAHTKVMVYKLNKKTKEKGDIMYQRVFHTAETKEIRLYGLGGEDVFELNGTVNKGILVRIIGGKGEDKITDLSQVKGLGKKTYAYDTPTGNDISLGSEGKDLTSTDPNVNQHDRMAFQYPYIGPVIPFNYNVDDGVFLGAGVLIRKPGFRKKPFAASHKILANVALRTAAYNFSYEAYFTQALGKFDLQLNADVQAPNFLRNFFGLGNQSVFDEELDISYYRVRFRSIAVSGLLRRAMGSHQQVFFGPTYQNIEVDKTQGRFIDQVTDNRLNPAMLFNNKQYAGLKVGHVLDNRDSKALTTHGVYWHTEFTALRGVNPAARSLTQLSSDLAFYWSFRLPVRVTLATRFGGSINFSGFEFFQASTLGGLSNLRGYRRTRFAGKSSAYNNTEIRIRLGSFKTYLFPAYFGILGFHDVGRVWLNGENSDVWHQSYGGGIWLAPFQQVVVSATYGISKEERLPLIRLGFFF